MSGLMIAGKDMSVFSVFKSKLDQVCRAATMMYEQV